jgi:hypothetical protein
MATLGGYPVEWRGFRGYVGGSSTGLKPIHGPDSGADGNALLTTGHYSVEAHWLVPSVNGPNALALIT